MKKKFTFLFKSHYFAFSALHRLPYSSLLRWVNSWGKMKEEKDLKVSIGVAEKASKYFRAGLSRAII